MPDLAEIRTARTGAWRKRRMEERWWCRQCAWRDVADGINRGRKKKAATPGGGRPCRAYQNVFPADNAAW